MVAIPQDIIDNIINELHDDKNTMKICSFTSRAFYTSSRAHLFHTVIISTRDACQRFHRVLTTNPQIGSVVRNFALRDYDRPLDPPQLWMLVEETLPQVLRMLPNIQHFIFGFYKDEIRWDSLTSALQSALSWLFLSTHIVSIRLSLLQAVPIDELMSFTSLKRLSLTQVTPRDYHIVDAPPVYAKNYLDSLCLYQSEPCLELLINAFLRPQSRVDISRLRTLVVWPTEPRGREVIRRILDVAASSLEHFEYRWNSLDSDVIQECYIAHDGLTLQNLSQLRTLALSVTISLDIPNHDGFSGLLSLLNTVAPDNQIQEIQFHISAVYSRNAIAALFASHRWELLDAAVMDQCKSLRRVGVNFVEHNFNFSKEQRARVYAFFREHFPILNEKVNLSFTSSR